MHLRDTKTSVITLGRFVIVLSIFLLSCNKYEDGPLVSFQSKKKRVTGYKKVTLYTIDGADSLAFFDWLYEDTDFQERGLIFVEGEGANPNDIYIYKDNRSEFVGGGLWDFENDKEQIWIAFPENIFFSRSFPFVASWKILRLTGHDMWLEVDVDGRHYELRFYTP